MGGDVDIDYVDVRTRLVALYEHPFAGKPRGRYRISMKLMRQLMGVRRVWPEQIEELRRSLYEMGYLLIDLETYFIVVSQQTFASYRRVNESVIAAAMEFPVGAAVEGGEQESPANEAVGDEGL
jgi:hypothetical protein